MNIQVVMYSTKFCAPCKIIKPQFNDLAKEYPEYTFRVVDPQEEFADDITAVPCFKVVKNSEVVFRDIGMGGFNKLSDFIKSLKSI
jgi:thiol-disulfide isomerase/thioredoxin